jgi:hypothetical protein
MPHASTLLSLPGVPLIDNIFEKLSEIFNQSETILFL